MKARREVAAIAQHATEPSDSHAPCDPGPSCEGRGGHTTLPSNSQRGHKNEPPFNVSKRAPGAGPWHNYTHQSDPAVAVYVKFVLKLN